MCVQYDVVVRQCYDTDSYNNVRGSIAFHHVRTVNVNGLQLNEPQLMVGCIGVCRLFVVTEGAQNHAINRIDPFSGRVDLAWLVDRQCQAVSVAGNDQLLVTMDDRIEHYDADGNRLRVIDIQLAQLLHESSLLPDSMVIYYPA